MAVTSAPAHSQDITDVDPTLRVRRVAGAIALPLAFVFQLACNTIYAVVSTESGLTDTGATEEALLFYGRYPGQITAALLLAMIGVLVMIPGLLCALRVLRPHRPTLGLWAVTLMIAGYVCYFGIVATGFGTLALATADLPAAAVPEATAQSPALTPFFALFVIGNLIGTLLLGFAVIFSPRLPRWAGALILGWPVGHAINVFLGAGEWFAVAGGALQIVGLAVLSAIALRTSDARWSQRG